MRRFTRLTNAFSKKIDNLEAAIALYFFHYNFIPRHTTASDHARYGGGGGGSVVAV